MPGPTKSPQQFKLIAGTDRPDRDEVAPAVEFPVLTEFPPAPQHLTVDGREMWDRLGQELVACGVVQVVDTFALEQLCYAWQLFRQKAKAGMDVTASENNALTALLGQFGLTPSARRRVLANLTAPPRSNRFAPHGRKPAS